MSIYLMTALSLFELMLFAVNYYYGLPSHIFLTIIYIFIIFLTILAFITSAFLARASKGERRTLFFTVAFFSGFLLLSIFTVGQMVWLTNDFELKVGHFDYFVPVYLVALTPILGYFIWKTLREVSYFNVKHFLPAIIALPILIFSIYELVGIEFKDLSTFILLETLICDMAIILSLLTLTSAYMKTESAVYYESFLFYFILKYISDIAFLASFKGMLDFEYLIAVFTLSNIVLFTILYRFYTTEITLLSYHELDAERKRYAELYAQVNELQEILKLINRMLRHDILNKLQIISGYVETYRMTEKEELLDKIMKAVDESVAYIDKIRELEKIVSTRSEKLKPVNLRKVADEVAKSFNIAINIKGGCVAFADEAVYSVIENLLSNAIKHGKVDKVDILLSELEDECEIRVVDYGVGIPSEIRGQIFNESFRYGEAGGTGLGLYIVKKLVERYGGKIWVEDTKPHGATFVIRLKAARVKLDER
ncbi:MAG: HAMP domain-containing histidine kinase [Archaeoglobus sp.]|uniref:sensor histidine kinase n=1 Tax=Archaeoglobus sp. TaxID=1872626 RepID=UPI001E17C673|nr:HAMP domain-containing sensor histidine kinase [Archaeoglobus sp.]MBO8179768.1 HAMP domain-containing histidine kinase [Archaeoglobus sp.]